MKTRVRRGRQLGRGRNLTDERAGVKGGVAIARIGKIGEMDKLTGLGKVRKPRNLSEIYLSSLGVFDRYTGAGLVVGWQQAGTC